MPGEACALASGPVSRILFRAEYPRPAAIIYLGRQLPGASSDLPGVDGRATRDDGTSGDVTPSAPCLVLLPVGFA